MCLRALLRPRALGPALTSPVPPAPTKNLLLLTDKVVLLVEDSLMIALECEASLFQLGAREVLMAATVADANAHLAKRPVDLAVLDFNLGQDSSLSIAEDLSEKGTPMIFATGYGEALPLPPKYMGAPVIMKPYTMVELQRACAKALGA